MKSDNPYFDAAQAVEWRGRNEFEPAHSCTWDGGSLLAIDRATEHIVGDYWSFMPCKLTKRGLELARPYFRRNLGLWRRLYDAECRAYYGGTR